MFMYMCMSREGFHVFRCISLNPWKAAICSHISAMCILLTDSAFRSRLATTLTERPKEPPPAPLFDDRSRPSSTWACAVISTPSRTGNPNPNCEGGPLRPCLCLHARAPAPTPAPSHPSIPNHTPTLHPPQHLAGYAGLRALHVPAIFHWGVGLPL